MAAALQHPSWPGRAAGKLTHLRGSVKGGPLSPGPHTLPCALRAAHSSFSPPSPLGAWVILPIAILPLPGLGDFFPSHFEVSSAPPRLLLWNHWAGCLLALPLKY